MIQYLFTFRYFVWSSVNYFKLSGNYRHHLLQH